VHAQLVAEELIRINAEAHRVQEATRQQAAREEAARRAAEIRRRVLQQRESVRTALLEQFKRAQIEAKRMAQELLETAMAEAAAAFQVRVVVVIRGRAKINSTCHSVTCSSTCILTANKKTRFLPSI
jgi:hypothetical protein